MTKTGYVQYSGSHATTMSKWLSIQQDGFKVNQGLRGTGVYFWEDNVYARDLAVAWYINSMRRGAYSKDKDKKCVILWADLAANVDEVADYTEPELRNYVLTLIKRLECADDKNQAGKIYDLIVERVQALIGNTIKIVFTTVTPPNKPRHYPTQTFGPAYCYIVIDVDCISIKDNEILDAFDFSKEDECLKALRNKNVLYGGKK